MALELAEDGRDGERRERRLARRVEAVDRLQQAERRDLDQVVELLPAALVAARELAGERQEARDELLARGRIALAVVADEQAPVLLGAREPVLGEPDMLGRSRSWPARLDSRSPSAPSTAYVG